jgi:hypothetical protein
MTYTCPVCERTSYNPNDAEHKWCGACQGYTSEPPPPGFRWVLFEDGRFGRLMEIAGLRAGAEYTIMPSDEVYYFDGQRFRKTLR